MSRDTRRAWAQRIAAALVANAACSSSPTTLPADFEAKCTAAVASYYATGCIFQPVTGEFETQPGVLALCASIGSSAAPCVAADEDLLDCMAGASGMHSPPDSACDCTPSTPTAGCAEE